MTRPRPGRCACGTPRLPLRRLAGAGGRCVFTGLMWLGLSASGALVEEVVDDAGRWIDGLARPVPPCCTYALPDGFLARFPIEENPDGPVDRRGPRR